MFMSQNYLQEWLRIVIYYLILDSRAQYLHVLVESPIATIVTKI